jgi:mannose-6-phosphate isomerase-like protein (cupin superfamily)
VAGDGGLDYLCRHQASTGSRGCLDRGNADGLAGGGPRRRPWDVEAQAPLLQVGKPSARPANIVNIDEAAVNTGAVETRPLATRERSLLADLPGHREWPGPSPHCHSEEEEVFVILDGEGTLELSAPQAGRTA